MCENLRRLILTYTVTIILRITDPQRLPVPCTDLRRTNLMDIAIPVPSRPPDGVSVMYNTDSHVHSIQIYNSTGIPMPSEKLFKKCQFFPEEFSFFITFRLFTKNSKTECLFAIEDMRIKKQLISIRISKTQVVFRYADYKVRFIEPTLLVDMWHSISLGVSIDHVTLTTDCIHRKTRRLRRHFPTFISITNATVFVGSCKSRKSTFKGQLKDLLLIPGGDASTRACPPEISPDYFNRILPVPDYPWRAIGDRDVVCTWEDIGHVVYDVYSQTLKVCVNGIWKPATMQPERLITLDYLVEYQKINTPGPSIDAEVFEIPNAGRFVAFANSDNGENSENRSAIYKWENKKLRFYQSLETRTAQCVHFFKIGNKFFLAVANFGTDSTTQTNSTIYKWSKAMQKFKRYQNLPSWRARGFEYFSIDGIHYLAVANYAKGDNPATDSVIYQWNTKRKMFMEHQKIRTVGAYDFTYFNVDKTFHFLVIANAFNGKTTLLDSEIYVWQSTEFLPFQTLETNGATDWEVFTIHDDIYLSVANAFNFGPQNFERKNPFSTNSSIYKLDKQSRAFRKYQSIPSHSAIDWEFAQIGIDYFLILSNAQNNGNIEGNQYSTIYRWQGVDNFVRVHSMVTEPSADWEVFQDDADYFFIYANPKTSTSYVLKAVMRVV